MNEILICFFTILLAVDAGIIIFKWVRLRQQITRQDQEIAQLEAQRARYAARPFPRPSYSFNEMRRLIAQSETWPDFDIITDLLWDERLRYTDQERALLSDALRLVIARRIGPFDPS